jgi:hypothetical protein
LNGRVAEAATDVHHLVAFADLEGREDLGAVVSETVHEDVAVLDELGGEDLVPEIDELVPSLGGFARAHDRYLFALFLPDMPGVYESWPGNPISIDTRSLRAWEDL